jgi:hypothetical protein
LKSTIVLAGYTAPTPVQKQSIPIVCGGRDLMACGKTLKSNFKYLIHISTNWFW